MSLRKALERQALHLDNAFFAGYGRIFRQEERCLISYGIHDILLTVKGVIARILPTREECVGLKAFGAHSKHKAPKLWGQYVPCEYVGFDGSSYLDLSPLTTESDIEITFRRQDGYTHTHFLFGTNPGGATDPCVGAWYGSAGFSVQNGSVRKSMTLDTNWHTLKVTSAKTYLDGVEQADAGTRTYFQTLVIGSAKAPNSGGAVDTRCFRGDISRVKVGNTIFIPVKDVTNNTFGLFDVATNTFYGNSGTGTITGGSLVQPVSYLESDGTQYIDTGMKGNQDSKLFIDFQNTAGTGMIFGSRNSATSNAFAIWTSSSQINSSLRIGFDATPGYTGASPGTDRMTIESDNVCVKQNGVKVYDVPSTWSDFETPNNLVLFAYDTAGVLTYAIAKIFACNLWQDGVLTRDFIPIRIGTTAYMLDKVEWKLYANAGTGAFTYGSDIPLSQLVPEIIKVNTGDIQYGQYGKNLFDKNNRTRIYGYFASSGTTWSYNASAYSNKIPCKPNTTYTARYNGNSTQAVLSFGSCSTDEEPSASVGNVTVTQGVRQNSPTINTPVTITTGANDKWLIVAYNVAEPQHTDMADHLQIEEGSTATAYEPYHFGIHTDGQHKLFVGSQGVVDLGTLNWTLIDASQQNGARFQSDIIQNLITGPAQSTKPNLVCKEYDTLEWAKISFSTPTPKGVYQNIGAQRICIRDTSFTTAASFKAAMSGVYIFYQRTDDTTFIPPITKDIPMLLSADSFADIQQKLKSEAWAVKVLDGTETGWNTGSGSGWVRFYRTFDDAENGAIVMSTHFEYHSSNNKPGIIRFGSTTKQCYFYPSLDIDTVEKWTAYLAEQYANGTPVILLYKLATPVTEDITITPITLTKDVENVITSEAELQTEVEVKYYGKAQSDNGILTLGGANGRQNGNTLEVR